MKTLQFKKPKRKVATLKKQVIKRIPIPRQVKSMLLRRMIQQDDD